MSLDTQHDSYAARRAAMVELQLRHRGIRDPRVLQAMARVPRHRFLPPSLWEEAYEDRPVPIGQGQTISQPYIVAAMLEAPEVQPQDLVLEIGTGSGYQAALLAELAAQVITIERHAVLAGHARGALEELGYRNVTVLVGDGSQGAPQHAPFDVIIVAAAAPRLPPALLQQLADGGRMMIPVGSPWSQDLQLVRRSGGEIVTTRLDPCRFVPLLGSQGFQEGD